MTSRTATPADSDHDLPAPAVARRTVLAAAGAVGAAGVLAACSSASSPSSPSPAGTTAPGPTGTQQGGGTVLATTSDIPVGGGKVIDGKMVVITQPKQGEFLAFTSTCTHQGCTVNQVQDGRIMCPCHGSQFSDSTGEVLQGPATTPLTEVDIKVQGTEIRSA